MTVEEEGIRGRPQGGPLCEGEHGNAGGTIVVSELRASGDVDILRQFRTTYYLAPGVGVVRQVGFKPFNELYTNAVYGDSVFDRVAP